MTYNAFRTWVTGEVVNAAQMNEQIRDNGTELAKGGFSVVIDGGGAAITTASSIDVRVPYKSSISAVYMFADQVGDIAIDIYKTLSSDFGDAQPNDSDSITSSDTPTISCDDYDEDKALSGWTTALAEGDMLRFYVESCLAIEKCTIACDVSRSS